MNSLPLILDIVLLIALAAIAIRWRRTHNEMERLRREQIRLAADLDAGRQQATQAEVRLAALGDAVLEVIITVDRDLRVIDATPGAKELFDIGDDVSGRSLIEVTRSNELDQLAADALAAGPASPQAIRDELDRLIAVAGRPFRSRAAAFGGGVVLALSDVSELLRLGRARRDFVANISHELRTPLTSIRLVLESLLSASVKDPAVAAGLPKIQVEVEALQQMAQELLDLAQIESGRALVRLVPTPVAQLIDGTVERLRPQAVRKRQVVDATVSPGAMALADAELVSRALGNLLHNAIKFTPPDGHIWVRARPLNGDIVIEVADSGPGIPRDDLPRVFERFFRGDRSRAGGGTGLGLAIAKHVVEAHGGKIWVESEGRPGHGAIFRFTLPAADRPA
jgi:two-component system phosphate regulon sensor histidine kinase PhoR